MELAKKKILFLGDSITLGCGTNDYGHGNAPIGQFSDRDLSTFYGALHSLILQLIEQYPGAQLVFMTPPHRAKDYKLGINQFGVRRAANLEGYMPYGTHPNDAGHRRIADRLIGFLKAV